MKKKDCYSLDADVSDGVKRQATAEGHGNKSLVANRLLKRGLASAGRPSGGRTSLNPEDVDLASIEARLSALENARDEAHRRAPDRQKEAATLLGSAFRKVLGKRRSNGSTSKSS